MADIFSEENGRKMRALEADLTTVLLRANDAHLEAAVAAFACIRCARKLLDLYPATARAALLEAIFPFLAGVPVDNVTPESNLLIM